MGNQTVNCGCFDTDVEKMKESNFLDPSRRPLKNDSLFKYKNQSIKKKSLVGNL
jgi:hypothetical protein